MLIRDPLGPLRFTLAPGWVELPGSSSLWRAVFVPWTDDAWFGVTVYRHRTSLDFTSHTQGAEWLEKARSALEAPESADIRLTPARSGRAALVHIGGGTGHWDALVVAGTDFDIVARGQSPSGETVLHDTLALLAHSAWLELPNLAEATWSEDDLAAHDQQMKDLRAAGQQAEAVHAASQVLNQAQRAATDVARHDGTEAARVMCALPALNAISVLAQTPGDVEWAIVGERLASRFKTSMASHPAASSSAGDEWVAHFRALQRLLLTGENGHVDGSGAMAAIRVAATYARLNQQHDTPIRLALLSCAFYDGCLRVVDARAKGETGAGGVQHWLLAASATAALWSSALVLAMDVDLALAVDEVAVTMALATLTEPEQPQWARIGAVLALLGSANNLLEVGDGPALATSRERLESAQRLLDELGDEGALRAWLCVSWLPLLRAAGDAEGQLTVIERGFEAARNDPVNARPHLPILEQARARWDLEHGVENPHIAVLPTDLDMSGADERTRDKLRGADLLVRQAGLLANAGRTDEALDMVVAGIEALLPTAPFGTDAADAFRTAAAILRTDSAPEHDLALRVTLMEAATGSLDARQVLFSSDQGRVAAHDAALARALSEEFLDDVLQTFPPWAIKVVDAARARALTYLIVRPEIPQQRAPIDALSHLPPPPAPAGNNLARLVAASDWMASACNTIMFAANAPVPLGVEDILSIASQSGALLLTMQPVDEHLMYFLVLPDGTPKILRHPAGSVNEVNDLVAEMSAGLRINVVGRGDPVAESHKAVTDLDESLNRLSRLLLDPIEEHLVPGVPLLVSPYRDLWTLPFGLLRRRDGSHLIDSHPITLTPSMATYAHLADRGTGRKPIPRRALVIGDPSLTNKAKATGLQQLDNALLEARDVSQELTRRDVKVATRTGPRATIKQYRREAHEAEFVHAACHAMLREPVESSCLFLASDGTDDGQLSALDITSVPLDDAVVVLSACDTAQGRPTADGLVGTARSFLLAGARAVVATNWKVSDVVARTLMQHLYTALFDDLGNASLSAALQSAILDTRADLTAGRLFNAAGVPLDARPAHWAPFVVIGDSLSWRYPPAGVAAADSTAAPKTRPGTTTSHKGE